MRGTRLYLLAASIATGIASLVVGCVQVVTPKSAPQLPPFKVEQASIANSKLQMADSRLQSQAAAPATVPVKTVTISWNYPTNGARFEFQVFSAPKLPTNEIYPGINFFWRTNTTNMAVTLPKSLAEEYFIVRCVDVRAPAISQWATK